MFKSNVALKSPLKLNSWRKISLGSWKPNGDSQIYCELKINIEPTLKLISESNQKVSLTAVTGRVLGKVLAEIPDLNMLVRWGRLYPRENVDIFFHVVDKFDDLSGVVVRDIHQKNLNSIQNELSQDIKKIKSGDDQRFKKIKKSWKLIPGLFSKCVLDLISFIFYELNLFVPGLGVPKDAFGSLMITNIGSLGLESGFAPLPPYTRVPCVIALGKIVERVVAINGTPQVQKQISLGCTLDHRVIDGAQGARMAKLIEHYFNHPELL
jgi:pyruvate/2-oxoglutarate dehydrogenase complex dihydrolipoamide acyltransferase (E2) component